MPSPAIAEALAQAKRQLELGWERDDQHYSYATDPVGYFADVLKFTAWSKQREIVESVRDHKRTAVRSAHGTGKTAIAARTGLWFLNTFKHSRVITTAPTWAQVETLLWREIHVAHAASDGKIGGKLSATRLDLGPDWFAIGWSTDKPERFQGQHAEHLLLVVDESSGVDEGLFEAAQGFLTAAGARLLLIGNPTQLSGEFFDAFHTKRASYNLISISAFDTPAFTGEEVPAEVLRALPTQEWVSEMRALYTEQSPLWDVRVLGDFPSTADNSIMALGAVERAQQREREHALPVRVGCDVARFGCFDAETELLTDQGWKPFPDVDGSERVLSLNGDVAEWAPITQVHRYPYVGPLNVYDGEKINFAITDNHKLVAAPAHHARQDFGKPVDWRLRRYDECADEFLVRRESTWKGVSPGPFSFTTRRAMPHGGEHVTSRTFRPDDWFRFLGWFVSEGNVYRERRLGGRLRVMIAQKDGLKLDALRHLLDRMGLRYRQTSGGGQVEFTSKTIGSHLIEHCGVGAAAKRVPGYVKNAPPDLIEAFLETFCLGDGSYRNGQRQSYYTSSIQLADDLHEMLVKIGRAGKIARRAAAGSVTAIGGREMVRLHDVLSVTEVARPRPGTVVKSRVERVHYAGHVYCVSTPHRTIMVRRKGCSMWSGNSDETVIAIRRGPNVRIARVLSGRDTMETTGELVRIAKQLFDEQLDWPTFVIDDAGLGGGVTDRLRELQREGALGATRIVAFNGANTSRHKLDYPNRRSEVWFEFADRIEELDLDPDEQLAADLVAPRYRLDSRGRRVVEPKEDTKKRLGRSPDRADAVLLTFALSDSPVAGPTLQPDLEAVDPLARRRDRSLRRGDLDSRFPKVGGPL